MLKEEPMYKKRTRIIEDHPQWDAGQWWKMRGLFQVPSLWTPQAPPHPQKPLGQKSSGTMREKTETLASHHQEDSWVIGHPLSPRSYCAFSQPSAPKEQDPKGRKKDGPTLGLLPTDTERVGLVLVKRQELPTPTAGPSGCRSVAQGRELESYRLWKL